VTLAEPLLLADGASPQTVALALKEAWGAGRAVGLAHPADRQALVAAVGSGAALDPWSAAVVLGSGGSSGRRRWCLQPLAHLEASAAATGAWLGNLGIDPSTAWVVNPLPWHHVSGLMPWVRCQLWGAAHHWLEPAQLHQPEALPTPPGGGGLLSLVPTQLHRLLGHPAGVSWLQRFELIWIGGAPLAAAEVARSREAGLRLAPCYGSTETASMVAALAPEAFLAGQGGCGLPLPHAQLRLSPADGAVEVRASSLSPGYLEAGQLTPFAGAGGWWRSGDRGRLDGSGLSLLGRLDGALLSGGETVHPEQVEQALQRLAEQKGVPLAAVVLVTQPDPEWGQRLVALVRGQREAGGEALIGAMKLLAATLPPAQRPRDWWLCPELAPNALGKWERQRWRQWLSQQR